MKYNKLDYIYECLKSNGEIEFIYKGVEHKMEYDYGGIGEIIIYSTSGKVIYLARVYVGKNTTDEHVDMLLDCKCFDGKSFVEIYNQVDIVDVSY